MRLRWFVRVAAVCVGLANLPAVVLWVGGLYVLGGEDATSLGEALPSALAAVIAGLATSQIVLRAFELPGRSFSYRYQVVVTSFCLGGVILGGLLGWVFSLDGTLFPELPPAHYSENPVVLVVDMVAALSAGLVGAAFGLVVGLAEGLVLGLPLAAAVGALRDD